MKGCTAKVINMRVFSCTYGCKADLASGWLV